MISYVLSLPRAPLKARVIAMASALIGINIIWTSYSHLHDDLAIARWYAWFNTIGSWCCLPMELMVVLVGRLPRSFARLSIGLNKTIPQIHADIARQQQDERERSLWL